jgi:ketosteroid isomerase-like protein
VSRPDLDAPDADRHRRAMADVLEALHRARADLDPVSVGELLTEDVEHVMPSSFVPDPVVGRDAVAEGLTTGVAPYFEPSSLRRRILRTTIDGDVAAVEQELTGRTHDGRPYSNCYVWIYEFRDLKICRLIEHADTLRAARMFGNVPSP